MINPYLSDFRKKDDEDELTPSVTASKQEDKKISDNPYLTDFKKKKQDTFTPVEQPKPKEEPKKNFFQKAGDVVKKTYTSVTDALAKKKETPEPIKLAPDLQTSIEKSILTEPKSFGPSIYDLASANESTSAQLTPDVEKKIAERQVEKSKEVNLVNATKALFGKGDKQLQEDLQVGLAQTYDKQMEKGKYGATAAAVDITSQFVAGGGDVVAGTGQVLKWQGIDGMADKLIKKGGELQGMSADTKEFDAGWDWKHASNPRFYTTMISRSMPFTLAMMPLGFIGGAGAGTLATTAGLTGIAKIALTVVGGGFLSGLAEGAYEGGSTYDEALQEALASGKTMEEARKIADEMANKTMAGNTALLTATNSLQLIPFLGKPAGEATEAVAKSGLFSKAIKGFFTLAGEFLSEGGEEVAQKNISLSAQDKPLDFFSPATQQEFVVGGLSGLVFTAGGAIVDQAGNDVTAQVTQNGIEQSKQIYKEIEQRVIEEVPEVATAIQEGKTQEEVDTVVQKHEEEVAKISKEVIKKKLAEEKESQVQDLPPIEAVKFDGPKSEEETFVDKSEDLTGILKDGETADQGKDFIIKVKENEEGTFESALKVRFGDEAYTRPFQNPKFADTFATKEEAAQNAREDIKKYRDGQIANRVKQAEELGKLAFEKGIKAVPVLDKKLTKLYEGLGVGEGIPISEAWTKAWDKANLAEGSKFVEKTPDKEPVKPTKKGVKEDVPRITTPEENKIAEIMKGKSVSGLSTTGVNEKNLIVSEGDIIVDRNGRLAVVVAGNSNDVGDSVNEGSIRSSVIGEKEHIYEGKEIGYMEPANQIRLATPEEIKKSGLDTEPAYKVTTADIIPTRDGIQARVTKEELLNKNGIPVVDATKEEVKPEELKKTTEGDILKARLLGEKAYKNGLMQPVQDKEFMTLYNNAEDKSVLMDEYNKGWKEAQKAEYTDTSKESIIKQKEQDATTEATTIRPERVSDTGPVRQSNDREQNPVVDENAGNDQTASIGQSGTGPQRIGKVGRATINSEVESILDSHDFSINKSDYTDAEIAKLKQYTGAGGKEVAGATGKGLLSEYYTPKEVTDKLWQIARTLVPDLNVLGKKALEPSIGIGSLLDGRPENLYFTGYEYQKVSGTIAAIINDKARINVGNGQEFGNPGNFEKAPHKPEYDLVMGNPPFGDRASFEKGKGEESNIGRWEEYFIKRGIDSLNKDGVLVYVVNSSFLKKGNSKGKVEIAKVGELVQAYRLPEGIFADTSIGTDIVVFKKKNVGDWQKRAAILTDDWYFTANSDNVMGTVEERTNKFGQLESYVKGTIEDIKRINPVSEREETVEVEKVQEVQKEVDKKVQKPSERSYILKDGGEWEEVNGKKVDLVDGIDTFLYKKVGMKGWIVTEGKSGKMIYADPNKNNALEEAKRRLEKHGDQTEVQIQKSIKKYGISPRYTESVEKTYQKAVKTLKPKAKAEPSYASKTIKHTRKAAKEGKLPAIIKPDKKKVATVAKQTIFGGQVTADPVELKVLSDTKVDGSVDYSAKAKDLLNYENGKYYHNLNYFSGDIYEKLDQLENDKATIIRDHGQKQYDKQLKGLEAVKPKPLTIKDITFDPMDRFISGLIVEKAETEYQRDRNLVTGFTDFLRNSRMPLSFRVEVWDVMKYVTGARASKGKKDIMGDIKADANRLFNYYIRNILDKKIQAEIVNKYNKEKNSFVNPDYSKFPVQIENMAQYFRKKEFNLSHTQASGVSMLTNKGVGLVAYGVGVGKTHTILTATMVAKQRGWTKRPVFIVPKSTIANTWIGTIKSMFPNETIVNLGGLTKPDIKRLTKERGSDPKKWVKDGEVSVLSHEGLLKLGLDQDQLNLAMSDLDDALSTAGGTERSFAKQQEKIAEIIGKAQSKAGNIMISDLGFDHLSVDEVHNFRKVFQGAKPEALNEDGTVDKSKTRRFGNIIGGQPSKMAQQLFLISQHILKNNNDRGVFLASATPFENHATEVYNILSLVARNRLKKMGIQNINDFYALFSNFETSLEKDTYGNFVNKEVMKSFKNLGELQRLIREFIDYKEDPALVRPDKRVMTPILQMTQAQTDNLLKIQEMLKPSEGQAEDGAVLKAVTYSVANSISPYFIKEWHPNIVSPETLIDNSPKLQYSMELLKSIKNKKETSKYGNFLYLGSNGVEYHSSIADYAIRYLDYKPSEVGIINGQTSSEEREVIKEKFRDGDIKLLIGGDPTKEGIDLQDNGYTTINVALGWNPTEMAQVEGRVWRQGNKRQIAPVIYPLVENSGDIFVYSKYEEKAGRINDLFSYVGQVFDVGEIDPKEKKLALMTAPEDKAKLEIDIDKTELEMKSMGLSTDILTLERLQSRIESLEDSIKTNEERISSGQTSWGTNLSQDQMDNYKKELSKAKANLKNSQERLVEKNIENIPDEIAKLRAQKEAFDIEIGKLEETYGDRLKKFQKEYDDMIASRKSVADHVNDFNDNTKDLRELSQEEVDAKKLELLKQIDEQNMLNTPTYVAPSGTGDTGGYADIDQTNRPATLRSVQFPELVKLVKDLTGSAPTLKAFKAKLGDFRAKGDEASIKLNPDIFNDPVVAGKVLSHEIGHLADWIPDSTLVRGNLIGRIASLNRFMEKKFENLTNNDIKKELKLLSQTWKPFNELASKKFTAYRYSSRELYADAVSVLLNDPALLQSTAPKFYEGFFEYIDKKPEFQKVYFDLMEELRKGEDYLMDQRLERMYEGFTKAKEKRAEIEAKSKVKKQKPFIERFVRNHIAKSDPIFRKLKKVNPGVVNSEAQQVREQLEEYRMRRNDIFLFLDKMATEITQPLADIGMTEDDFGAVLTLEREAFGDRLDLANPGGLIGNIPELQLKHFYEKKGLTQEQIKVFEQIKQRFHDRIFEESKRAADNGNYSKEMFEEKIEPNKDTYATFAIVHYIEKNYIGADIKKMVGTLSEHENPYISTLLKTISLIEWNNVQEAKRLSIEKNLQYFPDDMTKAEPKKDGTGRTIGFRKEQDREVLELMEDGKRVGYNVDPYIKTFFDNEFTTADEKHQLVKIASAYNSVFKKLVTSWKAAFAFWTNPIKDVKSTYIKFGSSLNKFAADKKGLSIGELLKEWVKAIPTSYHISKGEMNDVYAEMLKDKAISKNWIQFDENNNANEMDIDFLLRKYKVIGTKNNDATLLRKVMNKTLGRLLEGIEFAGGVLEANTKVAAYQIAKNRGLDGKKAGFLVRNYAGTPNYTDGGAYKQIDNDVFVFSNVMLQATRTSLELATDPKTASGYWFRTFNVSILPKIIMAMAIGGLFGEALKDMFEKMTEYDKTFYTTIPVGYDENGKVVYLRIPGEQIDNLIGGIAWKGLSALAQGKMVKPEMILSPMVSFVPDTTPLFTQVGDWLGYFQGRNPYDSYRGRLAIDDTTWKAGGYGRLKAMVQYSLNQNGLANFKTYDFGSQSTTEVTLQNTPVISRMFKTSDYGIQEKYSNGNDQEAARKAIAKRELVDKYVKLSRGVEDKEELNNIRREMIVEYFGNPPTKLQLEESNRLSKKFMIQRERGESPYADKLINSSTNAEKVDYLLQFKKDMKSDEFDSLVRDTHRLKIISDEVVKMLKVEVKKLPQQSSMVPSNTDTAPKTGFNFSIVKQAYASEGIENTNRQMTWSKDTRTKWEKFLGKVADVLPGDQPFENLKEIKEGITKDNLTNDQRQDYFNAMRSLRTEDPDWYSKNVGEKVERRILGKALNDFSFVREAEEKKKQAETQKANYANVEPTPYESNNIPVADKYEIPREVFFGIAMAEGGKINKFNLGAVDSNPNNAMKFKDEGSESEAAAKFLSGKAPVSMYGNGQVGKDAFTKAWEYRDDPKKMLEIIQNEGKYAGDPKTWKSRSIEEDPQNGAGLYYDSWSEYIMDVRGWKRWASN